MENFWVWMPVYLYFELESTLLKSLLKIEILA